MLVNSPAELAQTLKQLAEHPDLRQQKGHDAYQCFQSQSGALQRLLQELKPLLSER
jgi:3-deoxy-D-manno-octulosonic-acid transferase